MARTIKTGLNYFPFDVDFFNDDKIELVSSEFGMKGEIIAIRLLCHIYRNGYYYSWGKDESLLFAKRVGNGLTGALVEEVVIGLVKRSFFEKGVFDRFKILTSRGIQRRYIEAKDRSKTIEIIKEFSLIDKDVTSKHQNVTLIPLNDSIGTQRKEKESKEKESNGDALAQPNKHTAEEIELFKQVQEWIKNKAPSVSHMKEPLTIDQYLKIKERYPDRSFVGKIFLAMHNWNDLKKRKSAYLTFLTFADKEQNGFDKSK
jgi:hypothetical protein